MNYPELPPYGEDKSFLKPGQSAWVYRGRRHLRFLGLMTFFAVLAVIGLIFGG